jgi:hypothetical protein
VPCRQAAGAALQPDQVSLKLSPPEEDRHRKAKKAALDELDAYF